MTPGRAGRLEVNRNLARSESSWANSAYNSSDWTKRSTRSKRRCDPNDPNDPGDPDEAVIFGYPGQYFICRWCFVSPSWRKRPSGSMNTSYMCVLYLLSCWAC